MARVTHVRVAENRVREAADGDDRAASRELVEERPRVLDLDARGTAVAVRAIREVRVRRHDVPAERLLLESELCERAADDRGGRLGGAAAGELPFRGERDPGDARAAVAGRLADQQ